MGRNGTRGDALLRAIESGFSAVPKSIRNSNKWTEDELKNDLWIYFRSKTKKEPTKLAIRFVAMDIARMRSEFFRKGRKHGYQYSNHDFYDNHERGGRGTISRNYVGENGRHQTPAPEERSTVEDEQIINDHLSQIRRRFGSDGLVQFLLSRVMKISPKEICRIMDYEWNSGIGRVIAMGSDWET